MSSLFPGQLSFAAGELSPALYGRQELAKYNVGLRRCENFIVHPHGGVSKRNGLRYIANAKFTDRHVRLVGFQFSLDVSYVLEFGDCYVRFFKDGAAVMSGSSPYELTTPYAASEVDDLSFAQSADVLFIVHPDHAPLELARVSDSSWSLSPFVFKNGPFLAKPAAQADVTVALSGTTGNVTMSASASLFNAGHVGSVWRFTANVPHASVTVSTPSNAEAQNPEPSELEVFSSWMLETGGFWKGTVYLEQYDDDSASWREFKSYFSPSNSGNGKNFSDSGDFSEVHEKVRLRVRLGSDWDNSVPEGNVPEDAGYVRLSRSDAVAYGYVRVSSVSSATSATGAAEGSLFSTEATKLWEEGAWSDYRGWPSAIGFFQERLFFANTKTERQTFWASKSGDYYDFGVSSPVVDDDSLSATLVGSHKVAQLRHFVALNNLIGMSNESEWQLGSIAAEPLTPTNINPKVQGYRGCSRLAPIVVGNTILFVQEQGCAVRSLGYELTSDSYNGNDLSVLAKHLFEKHEIVSWAEQLEPDSMVWCVLDDGSVCALTFLQEHEVVAWGRFPLGGGARAVCCASVKDSDGDEVYFVVERNGVRTIERLASMPVYDSASGVYLDGCVSVAGSAPVSSVSGLDHLEGMTVSALVDGNVEEGLEVTDGSVQLNYPGCVVHVGVPYTAELETLDVALQRNDGTQLGRRCRAAGAFVRVIDTRGLLTGTTKDNLEEPKERSGEDYDAPVSLFSGDLSFAFASSYDSGRIVVSAPLPLPCTVLAVVPQLSVPEALR